jgi:hypothetical protein
MDLQDEKLHIQAGLIERKPGFLEAVLAAA